MIPADITDAKVYKLTCNGLVYYGSTCQPLAKRYTEHKAKAGKYAHNSSRYSSIVLFQQEGHTPTIELVEQVQCSKHSDLLARERYYIENYPCVNKRIPLRTIGEWYLANRDKRLQQMKQNYQNRKAVKQAAITSDS